MEPQQVVQVNQRSTSARRRFRDALQSVGAEDFGTVSERLCATAVFPEQFSSPAESPQKMRGEVALMYAVLEDAIVCFQKGALVAGRRAGRLAKEAEEWLFADDLRWPFSFVNICTVLGFEPGYIRLGLKQWRQHPSVKQQKRTRPLLSTQWRFKIAA